MVSACLTLVAVSFGYGQNSEVEASMVNQNAHIVRPTGELQTSQTLWRLGLRSGLVHQCQTIPHRSTDREQP